MATSTRRRGKKRALPGYKACRNCKAVIPENENKCPYCGSTDFSDEWYGLIIVIDPEKSALAKALGLSRKGIYAIDVP